MSRSVHVNLAKMRDVLNTPTGNSPGLWIDTVVNASKRKLASTSDPGQTKSPVIMHARLHVQGIEIPSVSRRIRYSY